MNIRLYIVSNTIFWYITNISLPEMQSHLKQREERVPWEKWPKLVKMSCLLDSEYVLQHHCITCISRQGATNMATKTWACKTLHYNPRQLNSICGWECVCKRLMSYYEYHEWLLPVAKCMMWLSTIILQCVVYKESKDIRQRSLMVCNGEKKHFYLARWYWKECGKDILVTVGFKEKRTQI